MWCHVPSTVDLRRPRFYRLSEAHGLMLNSAAKTSCPYPHWPTMWWVSVCRGISQALLLYQTCTWKVHLHIILVLLWKELSNQLLCLVSLNLQFICSFSDQILQIWTVLFQHSQHGVNNVCPLSSVNTPKLETHTHQGIMKNIAKSEDTYVHLKRQNKNPIEWICLTCLKMSSKFGLLFGSSFQHSFIKVRHSVGASSTDTTGLKSGGGCFRRSTISERQAEFRETAVQKDRHRRGDCFKNRGLSHRCLTMGWHVHHGIWQSSWDHFLYDYRETENISSKGPPSNRISQKFWSCPQQVWKIEK